MKLDYGLGRDALTLSDFVRALTSPTGVLLCGVSQRIHFIQREHSKHANRAHRRILMAPINPDKLSAISHLGLKDKIRNMYPVTVDHLLQFILQEWVLSQEIEDTGYRSIPGLTVAKTNSSISNAHGKVNFQRPAWQDQRQYSIQRSSHYHIFTYLPLPPQQI